MSLQTQCTGTGDTPDKLHNLILAVGTDMTSSIMISLQENTLAILKLVHWGIPNLSLVPFTCMLAYFCWRYSCQSCLSSSCSTSHRVQDDYRVLVRTLCVSCSNHTDSSTKWLQPSFHSFPCLQLLQWWVVRHRVVRHWHRLPREAVEALAVFKDSVDGALGVSL